jgi:hypothetical protein
MAAMPELSVLAPAAALVFLLAGVVKGIVGLGMPIVGIGLLSLFLPPGQAAALIVLPSLATNLWQMQAGPGLLPLARRLWPLLATLCLGAWMAGGAIHVIDARLALGGLGAALIAYALVALLPRWLPRIPEAAEAWLGPLTGLITGLMTGLTGVFAVPSAIYLQAIRLDRDALIQALGLTFTVATLALAGGLARVGAFDTALGLVSLIGLVAALVGMTIGQRLRYQISEARFRQVFLGALGLLGAHLALRAVL